MLSSYRLTNSDVLFSISSITHSHATCGMTLIRLYDMILVNAQ